jgi:hypothetical protein
MNLLKGSAAMPPTPEQEATEAFKLRRRTAQVSVLLDEKKLREGTDLL